MRDVVRSRRVRAKMLEIERETGLAPSSVFVSVQFPSIDWRVDVAAIMLRTIRVIVERGLDTIEALVRSE